MTKEEIEKIEEFTKDLKHMIKARCLTNEEYVQRTAERFFIHLKKLEITDDDVLGVLVNEDKINEDGCKTKKRYIYMKSKNNIVLNFETFFLIGYCLFNKNEDYTYVCKKNYFYKELDEYEMKALAFAFYKKRPRMLPVSAVEMNWPLKVFHRNTLRSRFLSVAKSYL